MPDTAVLRHPVTGRFMSGDCEQDCLTACAGLCGTGFGPPTSPVCEYCGRAPATGLPYPQNTACSHECSIILAHTKGFN